jgi:hypothetical protein
MKFCGPNSKKRQGQQYLWFAAVGKAQSLIAETYASPAYTRPGSLPASGLCRLVLEAENLDRCVSACGKRGIQYTEGGAIVNACNYMYIFFRLFSNTSCAISVR